MRIISSASAKCKLDTALDYRKCCRNTTVMSEFDYTKVSGLLNLIIRRFQFFLIIGCQIRYYTRYIKRFTRVNHRQAFAMFTLLYARKLISFNIAMCSLLIALVNSIRPQGGIEINAISRRHMRQRRILGRNFKTKLLTFSVFSCFLPSVFIHLSIQHNLTLKRKKQENTEKVRSLVLKFLPKIILCMACNLRVAFDSMPPQVRSVYEEIMWGGCWAVTKEDIENAGEYYRALGTPE